MKISLFMLFVAGLMPVVCAGIAKSGFKGYDNHYPRNWLREQTGWRARADAAQHNSLEAFPFFAAAVLSAWHAGVAVDTVNALSVLFVLARVAYVWAYITDRASIRSLVWSVGYLTVVALFVLALLA